MARIPTILPGSTQGTRPRRAPIPEQQPSPGTVQRAAEASEGVAARRAQAQQAQQIAQIAEQGAQQAQSTALARAEAEARLNKRSDDLARIRAENALREDLNNLVLAERTGGENFGSEESVRKFRDAARSAMQIRLQEFQSSLRLPQSAAVLAGQLDTLTSQIELEAVNQSIKTTEAELDENVSNAVSDLVSTVSVSPSSLDDAIAEINARIDRDMAGSVTPQKELATRQAAFQALATAAVDKYVVEQRPDLARQVLENSIIKNALDSDRARELRLKVLKLEGNMTENRAKSQNVFSVLSQVDPNIEFTSNFAQRAAQLTAALPINPSPEEVIGAYRQLVGEPPPEVLEAARSRFEAPVRFGDVSSARFAAARNLERMVPAFSNDSLTAEAEADFLAGVNFLAQENPVTGAKGVLSPTVRDALRKRGFNPDKMGGDQPGAVQALQSGRPGDLLSFGRQESGLTAEEEAQVSEEIARAETTIEPLMRGLRSNPASPDEAPNEALARQRRSGVQFFKVVDSLTGLSSTVRNKVFGVQFLGDLVPSGANVAIVRQEFEIFKTAAVAAIRRTERFADAERQQLLSVTLANLQGGVLKNPDALAAGLVGLDDWLAEAIRWSEGVLSDPAKLSQKGKTKVEDDLQAMKFLRTLIGAPPVVRTTQDLVSAVQSGQIQLGGRFAAAENDPDTGQPIFSLWRFDEDMRRAIQDAQQGRQQEGEQ